MQLLIWDEDLLKHGNDKINHIMKVSKNAEDEVRALRPPTRPAAAPRPFALLLPSPHPPVLALPRSAEAAHREDGG